MQGPENGTMVAEQPDRSPAPMQQALALPDEAATRALGAWLAGCLPAVPPGLGLGIFLAGDLGAGKTTLTRALLRALGHTGAVKSPTYTLVETYHVNTRSGHALKLCHFDFYRFQSPEEFADAGLEEYFQGDAVCLVEWPDKAAGFLPAPDMQITLAHVATGRHATLTACSPRGQAYLQDCLQSLPAAGCLMTPLAPLPLSSGTP